MAGVVTVDGRRVDKPGTPVASDATVAVTAPACPYVGRGGLKLESALRTFDVSVVDRVALDVGASTGGFTDCLLQAGARQVIAVDVGRGQLDWTLRNDPRVRVLEGLNARHLSANEVPEPIDFACGDVSFISMRLILPSIAALLVPEGSAIVLVKPQFELGRGEVGRGVVRDPEKHARAIRLVADGARLCGLSIRGVSASAIRGAKGNREFFLWLGRGDDLGHHLDDAVLEVTATSS